MKENCFYSRGVLQAIEAPISSAACQYTIMLRNGEGKELTSANGPLMTMLKEVLGFLT